MAIDRCSSQNPLFAKGGRGDFSGLQQAGALAREALADPPHPTFTKGGSLARRRFLAGMAGMATLFAMPAWARAASSGDAVRLAASWQAQRGYRVGVLGFPEAGALAIEASVEVPTRAHGLLLEPAGSLLAVARRPGDWLLRWSADGRPLAWRWIEPGRAFAGHVIASEDGRTLYTTEIDLDSGMGLIGVRDGGSLEKRAEWSTHGLDPHMLTWDATRPGALIVANGGVPTRPETGRIKVDLHRMDSSLVRLDARTGAFLGQWRLDDPRLSLRHLAWNGNRLGIALQAEHNDPAAKAAAPVLAVFDGASLSMVPAAASLAGYGGSIAALGGGFAVSCPRAQGVAIYGADGFRELVALVEVCPLASAQDRLWAGGRGLALGLAETAEPSARRAVAPDIRLDNHWIAL